MQLSNRIVMAPMMRSRAVKANTPNALTAEYYGLVISGDFVEVMWFQGLTEYLQPEKAEALEHAI